ncbi:MAG: NAD(P)H-quinone oxidoreductase [Myxococcales bacterium]|nr:MAG: NAD(P)H-quinone oxidoreductase [Myxococcales bacterium]
MKAVVFEQSGGPEVLRLAEVPAPTPGEHELLIDVHATALNRADLLQRRGLYPPPPGASALLGLECSGVVVQVGPGVTRAAVGDRVMALLAGGGYAERVVVHEGIALPVPERLSLEDAAAVPEAFLTASEALLVEAELRAGQSVLVTAAGSGVGSAAIQIAKLRGAFVIGSASAPKLSAVRALGADLALDREREDFVEALRAATSGRGVDAIVDFVGGSALPRHQSCLAERGRLVAIGLLGGATGALDLGRLLMKRQQVRGLVMRTRSTLEKLELVERFRRELLPAVADGRLAPRLDQIFPLSAVVAAHERMEQNQSLGKIVLRVKE